MTLLRAWVDRHTRVVTDFVSFRAGSRESFARPLCTLMPEIDVPRCSETRPFFHLRKHPERRAAAELSLAPAVPAARSRRRPPERSRRMPGLYVCALAHTPFLSGLSAGSGPELRMTRAAVCAALLRNQALLPPAEAS